MSQDITDLGREQHLMEAAMIDEGSSEAAAMSSEELSELESKPKTRAQKIADRVICALPIVVGLLAELEYMYLPNAVGARTTYVYVYFLLALVVAVAAYFVASFFNKKAFAHLRYKAPFYCLVFLLLLGYDYLTTKTRTLLYPFFPSVDEVLNAMISDSDYLIDSTQNSLKLLFVGYSIGTIVGLITGIACGYSKKIDYWIAPFRKLLGAIPSTTWIPVVMVLATSLFQGAVFIIALGVWFAVTLNSTLEKAGDDTISGDALEPTSFGEPFYVLAIGSDSREGSGTSSIEAESGDNERSDVMILVRIDRFDVLEAGGDAA